MPRIIAIFLLIVIAWQSGGYYMAFEAMRHTAQKEAQEKIKKKTYNPKAILSIEIPKKNLTQLRHFYKDEYILNGKLYDLLRIETPNDSTLRLYCLHDADEQKIYENLYQHFAPLHSPIGTKKAQQLSQFLSLKYTIPQLIQILPPSAIFVQKQKTFVYSTYITPFWANCTPNILSPPPKELRA